MQRAARLQDPRIGCTLPWGRPPAPGKPHGYSVLGQLSLPRSLGDPTGAVPQGRSRRPQGSSRGAAGRGGGGAPREHTHRKPGGGPVTRSGSRSQQMPSPAAGLMPSSRVRPANIRDEPKSRSRDEATGTRLQTGTRGAPRPTGPEWSKPGHNGVWGLPLPLPDGGAVGLRICTGARVCTPNL